MKLIAQDNDLDTLAITETWLSTDDFVSTGRMTPAGYQQLHVPRANGTFVMRQLDTPNAKIFELMDLHLRNGSNSTRLIVIYRPVPNTKMVVQPPNFS